MAKRAEPLATQQVDHLRVEVYASRKEMGAAAAWDIASQMRQRLAQRERVRMIFAAAPSQNEMLAVLCAAPGVNWERVDAFHMDEYVSLPTDARQRFGNFLREHIFDIVHPGRVEYIGGTLDDVQSECRRYAALLSEETVDIVCAGIGENGHMAFNDPHVADFADPEIIKPVTLDEVCRRQQVRDGAFATLADVPEVALTLTMPALMAARHIFCVVPGTAKARAVARTCLGSISEECPATAMRRHANAILYVDQDAAAQLSW